MRVAVVHDWLVANGGAERVLASILQCYPQAEIFTVVDFMAPAERGFLAGHKIHTSFIQSLPFARRHYRRYLPLMPLAVESFDLSEFDLVLSSSFCVAKGVLTGPDQTHVCYLHSPMRYAWDLQHQYLRESNLEHGVAGFITRLMLHKMRLWDYRTGNGVDVFVSNSRFIARRAYKIYRRTSSIVHPPVDTEFFAPGLVKEDFYLTVSRLVPYKCVGLIVDAFRQLPEKQLVVIGDGPEFDRLKHRAGANVRMLGYQSADVARDHLQRARAFVFAALEDFGIAPVEAQACATPVIAYGRGGVTESVIAGKTGVFFAEQTADAIAQAIRDFDAIAPALEPADIRANALRFSNARFKRQLLACVEAGIQSARSGACVTPDQPLPL
jgi:glycosyltransferase involved in cell wall biosynthesis